MSKIKNSGLDQYGAQPLEPQQFWTAGVEEVNSDIKSLDFTFKRFLTKLYKTIDISVVTNCKTYFGTQPPSELLYKRRSKFLEVYNKSQNSLCHCWLCSVKCCHHVDIVCVHCVPIETKP